VADEGREKEVVTRLARVGYDNSIGYVKGGVTAWKKSGRAVNTIKSIDANELNAHVKCNIVIDVRTISEYNKEHLDDALHYPLSEINNWIEKLNPNENYIIHCQGGYRSMIATSILKSKGINNIIEVKGGYAAIATNKTTSTTCAIN
jgi:rhodanese-related sulfurtransferase